MDFFKGAIAVRLCSPHGKYLIAMDDKVSVIQDVNGSAESAKWTVEQINGNYIWLKSCYGKYLTASNEKFLLGATGRKVIQSLPGCLDSSMEWKPVRKDRERLKLQTESGRFLRANAGLPPWLDSVTTTRFSSTQGYMWRIDILEKVQDPTSMPPGGANNSARPPGRPTNHPANTPGQHVNPGSGVSVRDAMVYAGAISNMGHVASTIYQMTNQAESTNQISTATSQPENGVELADAKNAYTDAGANGGDVANEEILAEVYEGEGVASVLEAVSSFFFGLILILGA